MTFSFAHIDTPLGMCAAAVDAEGALVEFVFLGDGSEAARAPDIARKERARHDPIALKAVTEQVHEYFARKRERFDLPLKAAGTVFQHRVWAALCDIPFGAQISYQELATRVGDPKASQAVGGANGRNPIALIVPCHRVIGKNGSLTGYAGGLGLKARLLRFERYA